MRQRLKLGDDLMVVEITQQRLERGQCQQEDRDRRDRTGPLAQRRRAATPAGSSVGKLRNRLEIESSSPLFQSQSTRPRLGRASSPARRPVARRLNISAAQRIPMSPAAFHQPVPRHPR